MQFTKSLKLSQTLQKLHAAIIANTALEGTETPLEALAAKPLPSVPSEVQESISRAFEDIQAPALPSTVTIDPLSRYATSEAVLVSVGCPSLSRGARRLWEVLHATSTHIAALKGYSGAVSQITLALPTNGVAFLLGCTTRHLYRLRGELEGAGLLDSKGWADNVEGQHMHALTLWAVKTSTTNTTPKLLADDFLADWRDFGADLKAKNTVRHAMSSLKTLEDISELSRVLVGWHVTGRFVDQTPVTKLGVTLKLDTVRDAISGLSMLADCPPSQRRDLVQSLAGWLCDGLNDSHSFRWWCGVLWGIGTGWEAVGALQAKLSRLIADLTEWDGVLCPAALFNARIAPATS